MGTPYALGPALFWSSGTDNAQAGLLPLRARVTTYGGVSPAEARAMATKDTADRERQMQRLQEQVADLDKELTKERTRSLALSAYVAVGLQDRNIDTKAVHDMVETLAPAIYTLPVHSGDEAGRKAHALVDLIAKYSRGVK